MMNDNIGPIERDILDNLHRNLASLAILEEAQRSGVLAQYSAAETRSHIVSIKAILHNVLNEIEAQQTAARRQRGPKRILVLDFDGVCHMYTTKWEAADIISDGPVPGLFEFIFSAAEHFDIQIYSSRSVSPLGIMAMKEWFYRYYFEWLDWDVNEGVMARMLPITFPTSKPPAFIAIDDRCYCFVGSWPAVSRLLGFRPWLREGSDQ
jgi:hypothetical protein